MATILCPRALCLQSITAYVRVTRGPLAVRSSAAFTTASRHPRRSDLSNTATRPSIASQLQPSRTTLSAIAIRRQSTPSPVSSSTPPEDLLTWNRFFDLRKKRRWINLGCSVVTAAAAVGLVTPAIAAQDFDSWGAQISGLDPVIVLGISTFAIAAGGWLCGPSFGTAMFSLWAARRGWNKLIAEKEKSFYARIKRYRADPSASSPQNPIPDYYGEKIASVKDYRRWLKDQKAFNLKKSKNML